MRTYFYDDDYVLSFQLNIDDTISNKTNEILN